MPASTSRARYYQFHRIARLGNLGTLACSMAQERYQWFLREVYDLRFPHVGNDRHTFPRTFCSLRGGLVRRAKTITMRSALERAHYKALARSARR